MTTAIATTRTPPTLAQRPYRAYGAALSLMYCKDAEVLLDGPAGTGKTRAILEKAHICLTKYAGCRVLAVRKTRASMTHSVLVTYEEKVLPAGSAIKAGPTRAHRDSYRYPNGSELVIGGMDNPDKIMSTEYDMVLGFEWTQANEDDHEKLTTRLRNGVMPYQQLIADCNPGQPMHWLNQRCQKGLMTRLLSRHADNPSISAAYMATLERLSGARKLRLHDGIWAAQEGLVYDTFDPAVHVLAEMPAGWISWRKIRSIDFGFTNPFVCQWWAIDPDGRMYLYRELYHSQRTVATHAGDILILSGDEWYEASVADHDAGDRATLEEHRISTLPANKTVSAGIQAVQERLKIAPDGKPRLYILAHCLVQTDPALLDKKPTCTEQELSGYLWAESKEGRTDKEEPVKLNDHGCDAMRYAVMQVDHGGTPGV